ncbi:response regulator [Marinobacteraceae bacterium S3BR75-40.1]
MIKKTLHAALIGLGLLLSSLAFSDESKVPVLDLSTQPGWEEGAIYTLNTQWAFYWQQWVKQPQPTDARFAVPGLWNARPRLPVAGYASFALRLKVPPALNHIYLATPGMPSAWSLWVNGREVAHNGQPGTSLATEQPEFGPKLVSLPVGDGELDLVLRISNYHYKEGGIWHPLRITGPNGVDALWMWPRLMETGAIVALVVTAIYLFSVFGVRRRETAVLWFGLFCLLLALRTGLGGQRLLYDPQWLSWAWQQSLEHLFLYLSVPAFLFFYHALFPGAVERRLAWIGSAVAGIFALTTLVFPVRYFADWSPGFQAFSLIVAVVVAWRLTLAVKQRRSGSILFAVSFVLFLVTVIHDLLLTHFVIDAQPLLHWGAAAFIVCQVVLLHRGYARSLSMVEQLTEELRSRNRRLEEADAHKDEFLAMTSHEMRTPLHAISGLAEDLRHSIPDLPADQSHQLDLITSTAGRLSGLVNDILDLAAIRHGQLALSAESVSLRGVASNVMRIIEPMVAGRDLVLSLDIGEGADRVRADANRLQQILVNLLANSAKSTAEGFIWLKAEREHDDRIRVAVVDTGEGFPEAIRDALFSRSDDWALPTEDRFRNGGLGLLITRRLVRLHGDDLHIDSRPGMGTEVYFYLRRGEGSGVSEPAAPVSTQTESREMAKGVDSDAGPLVAVVDDDEANRTLLRRQLQSAGYRTVVFASGPRLLEYLQDHTPDLVLLDIMMPDMSGYEVLGEIRRQWDPAVLPVIMVTARHLAADIVRALDEGASDYLAKPYAVSEMLARVRSQLGVREAWLAREENRLLQEEMARNARLQSSLELANRRMLQVLEQAGEGVLLLCESLSVLYVNSRARGLTGLPLAFGIDLSDHLLRSMEEELRKILRDHTTDAVDMIWPTPGGQLSIRASAFQEGERWLLSLIVTGQMDSGNEAVLGQLSQELNANRERMAALESMLQDLSGELARDRNGQSAVEDAAGDEEPGRSQLVELMRHSLHCWERYLGKSKVDLAEESRCWRVYLDGGTAKTRTLDKYLSLALLPRRPRWRLVIRTANFVMAQMALPEDEKVDLKQRVEDVEAVFDTN